MQNVYIRPRSLFKRFVLLLYDLPLFWSCGIQAWPELGKGSSRGLTASWPRSQGGTSLVFEEVKVGLRSPSTMSEKGIRVYVSSTLWTPVVGGESEHRMEGLCGWLRASV